MCVWVNMCVHIYVSVYMYVCVCVVCVFACVCICIYSSIICYDSNSKENRDIKEALVAVITAVIVPVVIAEVAT